MMANEADDADRILASLNESWHRVYLHSRCRPLMI